MLFLPSSRWPVYRRVLRVSSVMGTELQFRTGSVSGLTLCALADGVLRGLGPEGGGEVRA